MQHFVNPECNKPVQFHTGPSDSRSDWLTERVDEEEEVEKDVLVFYARLSQMETEAVILWSWLNYCLRFSR